MADRHKKHASGRQKKENEHFERQACNRFVAYLDMLGMSNLTLRDPDYAIAVLVALDELVSQYSKLAVVSVATQKPISHPITWTFSDSVVIVTEGETDADWWAITSVTAALFVASFLRVIPLRGAIAHGKFMVTGNIGHIFGGPALVRAHDIAEDTGWLGVVVDEAVALRYFDLEYLGVSDRDEQHPALVRWPVHTKSAGIRVVPCLNWPLLIKDVQLKSYVSATDVYSSFSVLFGEFDKLSDRAKSMYLATADFINQANA